MQIATLSYTPKLVSPKQKATSSLYFGSGTYFDENNKVEIKSEEQLRDLLAESKVPVLIQFHAEFCGACKKQDKINEDLPNSLKLRFKLASVDIKEQLPLAQKYGVSSLPTSILYHNGKYQKQSIGLLSEEELQNWLN